ncbi:hypothetical protein [Pararhizobium mangrovi]|uniref:Uncharacterized protein n=1 Tax=Pararhizobium mangrovi TaxID=2590452 RepID=A0A506U8L6_9HYPH|nr:hypothetical protein [Pararhizobium mangrovi]TPW30240.1 hypothetical protein FJU11_05800 [Pararhizobium mangrovi]
MKHISKQRLQKWLHRLGSVLGIAGVGFVVFKLYSYSDTLRTIDLTTSDYVALVCLAALYGAICTFQATAWRELLAMLGVNVTPKWAVATFATTQIGKYVPGNIFQYAGRQAVGAAAGLPNVPLAKSTLFELMMICAISPLFAVLIVPLFFPDVPSWIALVGFVFVAALAIAIARLIGGLHLARGAVAYLLFMILNGAVFMTTLGLIDPKALSLAGVPVVIGAYVVSWLVGLVTPGAPAGLGVRETVLVYLFTDSIVSSVILLAVLVGRIVTVSGDLMFYGAGRAMASRVPHGAQAEQGSA